MKGIICITLIVIISVGFVACAKKPIYSAPTKSQVNDLIIRESINVKAIKEAKDFTVILYQNEDRYGHYIISQNQEGRLSTSSLSVLSEEMGRVYLGGVASGKETFVTIIINDEQLYRQAKYLEVILDDERVFKQEIKDKGIVILYNNVDNKDAISDKRVVIYDKDDKIIYED